MVKSVRRTSRGTTHWASPTGVWLLLTTRVAFGQSVTARWGQASVLLSPASVPRFVVSSGKTYVAGQTLLSTPSTSSLVSLDLSQPITDLDNPPWAELKVVDDVTPTTSYANLVALNQTTALGFGGDATGDPLVPVQTRSDSAYLLSLDPSGATDGSVTASWKSQTTAWTTQPERREFSLSTSASNGQVTRSWIYGGLRADGSGIGFDELWEMQIALSSGQVEWARAANATAPSGQGAVYDGAAVLVPAIRGGQDAQPTIYFVGGVLSSSNALTSLAKIPAFTPSASTIGSGTWSEVAIESSTAAAVPSPRRGHSAAYVGSNKIWISGGRDLTGTIAYADSWILDIDQSTWSRVADASEASWGSSTVVLGDTILTAFGYGTNAPASTNLRVYAFGNDTWLNAYEPSYLTTIPTNPKASSGSTSAVSPMTSASNPTNPKAHADSSASSSSSSSSASSDSSSSSSSSTDPSSVDNSGVPTWTEPGSPRTPAGSDASGNNGGNASGENLGTPKSLVAGAVVGSLLGALALAAIGVYGMRKRKRSATYDDGDRYTGGFIAGGKRFKASDRDGYDDDEHVNMVEKGRGGLGPDESARRGGGGGGLTGLFTATPKVSGTRRQGYGRGIAIAAGGRRFDMLRDEDDDLDDDTEEPPSTKGWTRFDENDDNDDEDGSTPSSRPDRVGSDMSDASTRIGVGIWGGMGLARSESVKSGTSYLGTNLGGFLRSSDSGNNVHCEYGGLGGAEPGGDASLTPIAEWDEHDLDDEEGGTVESDARTVEGAYAFGGGQLYDSGPRSVETHQTHQTRSTFTTTSAHHTSVNSHAEASIRTATRVARPFSPSSSSSLYGSGFATPAPFVAGCASGASAGGVERSTSTSSSMFMSPVRRDNSSSWWSRLKPHQHAEVPTATAFEAIRDPTPAPKLDGQQNPAIDPFSHAAALSLNEHGLMGSKAMRGVHDRSISSNVSEVTATSSILEERMRGMDVIQRIRTGEGSDGSASVGKGGGNSNENTPELSQNPFADPPALPRQGGAAGLQTPGSVIFAGSQAAFSPQSETPPPPVPSMPPFPLLPVVLPPSPAHSQVPPLSPRKNRLVGPRPQPSAALPSIGRSGSVKDLVAEIERRNSLPSTPSPTSPSPPKAARSRTTRTATASQHGGSKIEHGLVKKPKLYVANP